MSADAQVTAGELQALALRRLVRVLGEDRGARTLEQVLRALRLTEIATPDQLLAVAQALATRGPIEAAVGGLLGVDAVLRGAIDPRRT